MKTKLLFLLAMSLLAIADVSQAGGRCGWGGRGYWGGGWGAGRGWCGGPYWGGGWGGWGGWGWGPAFGVSFVAPVPAYRTVYVRTPAPTYVTYSGPTLARAQARLARLGYYPGSIDGAFGPMTRQALRSYQVDYGLPVTGRLDYQTRDSLGV